MDGFAAEVRSRTVKDHKGSLIVVGGGFAGLWAVLALGASAVQIGTGLLRAPEATVVSAWAEGIGRARPEDTTVTGAFSDRLGRALRTEYVATTERPDAPAPLPYPLQRSATAPTSILCTISPRC